MLVPDLLSDMTIDLIPDCISNLIFDVTLRLRPDQALDPISDWPVSHVRTCRSRYACTGMS